MQESDLVHYSLNLTTIMKKSYHKTSNDVFSIHDFDIRTIRVHGSSIATLNITYLKKVIEYLASVEHDLNKRKNNITYYDIRYELRKRKTLNLNQLRKIRL